MRIAALLILSATAVAASGMLRAASVHRCIGEHGEIAFSETRCASGRELGGAGVDSPASRNTPESRAAPVPTCPATPDALRDVIAEAFSRRDANALAGVMRWDGVSGGAANVRMRDLAELTQRPLTGVELGGEALEATIGDAPAPPPATLLIVRTGGPASGESEREFRVTRSGGCYWLDW